jgi:glycosyltransferase involved in cell wall biosynthesis
METLKANALNLPANASMELTGRLGYNETIKRMTGSDVIAAPSIVTSNGRMDGIPNVILEAMACRLPVVASKISGIPEVVINGRTGILVEPGNIGDLVDALKKIWEKPQIASAMGEEGRKLIEKHFDVRKKIEEFTKLLMAIHS